MRIVVDPATLTKWERGEREPAGTLLDRVKRFLNDEEQRQSNSRRAG